MASRDGARIAEKTAADQRSSSRSIGALRTTCRRPRRRRWRRPGPNRSRRPRGAIQRLIDECGGKVVRLGGPCHGSPAWWALDQEGRNRAKRPVAGEPRRFVSAEAALRHLEAGLGLGLAPEGYVVVDVDRGSWSGSLAMFEELRPHGPGVVHRPGRDEVRTDGGAALVVPSVGRGLPHGWFPGSCSRDTSWLVRYRFRMERRSPRPGDQLPLLAGQLRSSRGYVLPRLDCWEPILRLYEDGPASHPVDFDHVLQLPLPGVEGGALERAERSARRRLRQVERATWEAELPAMARALGGSRRDTRGVFWPVNRGRRNEELLRRAERFLYYRRREGWRTSLLTFLHMQNVINCWSFDWSRRLPLPWPEVLAIARQAERFDAAAKAGHSPAFEARQKALGRRGGVASGRSRRASTAARDRSWAARVAGGEAVKALARAEGVQAKTVRAAIRRAR